MKRALFTAFFTVLLVFAGEAHALDLSQARAQGVVGEKLDGYIGAVVSSSDANAVVSEINDRRRTEYEKISKANGQPVSVVGKVAAENIINNLPRGAFYQDANGSWKKK